MQHHAKTAWKLLCFHLLRPRRAIASYNPFVRMSSIINRVIMNRGARALSARAKFGNRNFHFSAFVLQETMEHENTFHKISDRALEELYDGLGAVEAKLNDCDVTLSQGVLNFSLGEDYPGKAWVINKQTPNRQIWWSSPESGPRRFEFEGLVSQMDPSKPVGTFWRCTRNRNDDLWNKLKSEVQTVTGITMAEPQQKNRNK